MSMQEMNRRAAGGIEIVARARQTAIAMSASIGLGLVAPSALGTPTGGEFITPQGGGGIYQFGDVTNVLLDSGVSLNRHIIDWQGLNLAQNESLNFLGLDGYRVLNRVVGSGATQIDGILNASTGHVYVVNAAGVIFGQNSVINASSMHAAAAAVTNEDFLSGDSLTFDVGPGSVEFHGTLNGATHVSLIGSRVVNTSDLSAGMIVMAVGDTVILKDLMNSRISVEIDGSDMNADYTPQAGSQTATIESGDPAIHNSGSLNAGAGGGVTLAAGDMLGLAIQHDGEIHAAGGDVDIVAQGGAVWTSMDNPDVGSAGLIDVSSTSGAGTISLIGSAVVHEGLSRAVGQGGSVALRSFANTVLDDAARIDTSGGGGFGVADAGTILLESTNGTVYAGQPVALVANGGTWGGNGGDVTIRGASLEFLPIVRQTANSSSYQNGALVIDASGRTRVIASADPLSPVDYADLSTAIVGGGQFGRVGVAEGQTLSSVSGALTLASTEALRMQSSLTIDDVATLVSTDIQLAIDDAEQRVQAHTLTLVGGVSMEDHATLHGGDSLRLTVGAVMGDGVSSLTLSTERLTDIEGDLGGGEAQLGSLTISAGSNLAFNGDGNDLVQSVYVAGDLTVIGAGDPIMATATQDLELHVDGNVSIAAGGETPLSFSTGQGINLQAGGAIDNKGSFSVDGNFAMSGSEVDNTGGILASSVVLRSTSGDLTTSGPLEAIGTARGGGDAFGISLDSAGALTVVGDGLNVAPDSLDGFVNLTAVDTLTLSTTIDAPTGAVSLTSTAGDMTIGDTITGGVATLTAAGDVHIDSSVDSAGSLHVEATEGHLAVAADLTGGDVTLAGGSIGIGSAVTSSSTLAATATSGDLDVDAAVTGEAINLSADAGVLTTRVDLEAGELALSGGSLVTERTLKTMSDRGAGDITLHAGTGDLRIDQTVDAAGALEATADAGEIVAAETLSGQAVSLQAASGMTLADILSTSTALLATTDTGDVSVAGVQAGGDLTVNVLDGSMTATGLLDGDAVDVAASGDMSLVDVTADDAMTLAAGGALTLDTATAAGNLTVNGGDVTASGGMSGADVNLTGDAMSVAGVTASGDLTINGGDVTASGGMSGDAVALTGDAVSVADVTATGTLMIDAASLMASGDLAGDSVDALSTGDMTLANVTADDSVALAAGGVLTLSQAGAGGDLRVDAGSVNVTGELAGDAVSLDAAGDMTLAGVTADDSLTMTAGGDVTLAAAAAAGDLTITSGDLTASGAMSGADVNLTGDAMSVAGVTASGDLTIMAGDVTASGGMSGDAVALTGDAVSVADVTATGTLMIDAASLMASGDLAGDSVDASSTGDMTLGDVTADDALTMTAGGEMTTSGAVTGGQVAMTAAALTLGGGDVAATTGDLTIDVDAIDIAADTTVSAFADMAFGASGSRTQLAAGLDLDAGGDLSLNSAVDGGGPLTASAGGELLVSGDIGGVEAVSSLTLDADRLVLATGTGVIAATGDMSLNGSSRDALEGGLPSIYGFGDALTIASRDGDLRIGSNQGLAYLGDLTLDAGGDLTVGDMTALGDLTLRGSNIVVQRRAAEAILTPSGSKASPQTSIVSGGDLLVDGAMAVSGDGADPRLAGVDSTRGVDVRYVGDAQPFTAADMELVDAGQDRLALVPLPSNGPSPDDPTLVAAESHLGEVEFEAAASDLNWRLVETEVLAQLGIEVVEGAERPSGGSRFARAGFVENELTPTLADPAGGLIQVVRSRLDPRFVQRAVVAYADVISTGNEPGTLTDAGTVLRAAEASWRDQPAGDAEPLAYQAWLQQGDTPVQQDAMRILTSLQTTYEDLHRAGLTAAEIEASRRFVASQMGEDGAPVQLAAKADSSRPKS